MIVVELIVGSSFHMPEGKLIVIVDDDEAVRDSLGALVEAKGFKAVVFSSGHDFLRHPRSSEPDCILLDLNLPLVSGWDVLEALSARGSEAAVIVMTGGADANTERRAAESGVAAVLNKPVRPQVLIDEISRVLAIDG